MGFELKRRIYESLPPGVKSLVGLVPFGWIAGPAYRRTLARAPLFERASTEEIRSYQEQALGEMLDFATSEVPAYAKHRSAVERYAPFDALKDFPLLDRDALQQNLRDHLPRDFERIPHYEITTGGTSGDQLRLYVDDASQSVETAFVHRVWSHVGYTPRARKATFRGVPFPDLPEGVYWRANPIYNELQLSPFHMSEATMGSYVERLVRYAPEYLHGYPSAIDFLADYIRRNGLAASIPPVRAAFLASEACTPGQRSRISEVFSTRVFPIYGHSERLILGAECETEEVYHHVPDYGVLEIVGSDGKPCERDGERGELVGTGLLNRSMPLIRYRTGDRATRRDRSCACGRNWDRFDDVEGRWKQDMLVGKTGARISLTALNMHGSVLEHVARFQYRQTEPGSCSLRVVPAPGFTDADAARIEQAYRDKLGAELDVVVELVDEIPLTERGKLKAVVRE